MRALLPASLVAAAAVSALPPNPDAAHAAPPDRGGSLEIRDESTGEIVRDGVPEVCTFSLLARDADSSQRVSWRIAQRAADGTGDGTIAETGSLSVDRHGSGRSGPLSLADGTYTLGWRLDGEQQRRGTTDFTIDCGDASPGDRTSAPARSETSGPTPGSTPSTARPDASTAQPGGAAGAYTPRSIHPRPTRPATPGSGQSTTYDGATSATPASSQPASHGDDLAQSGTDVSAGALATAAALLLGAGTYLLLRRRRPQG